MASDRTIARLTAQRHRTALEQTKAGSPFLHPRVIIFVRSDFLLGHVRVERGEKAVVHRTLDTRYANEWLGVGRPTDIRFDARIKLGSRRVYLDGQRSITSGIMESDLNVTSSTRNLGALFAATHQSLGIGQSDFCTADNLEEALSTLSEELESFGLTSPTTDSDELRSVESMKSAFIKLIDASWSLVHKHRALVKTHDRLNDVRYKIANDNSNLSNHVKRLKDDLEKKQQSLCEAREKERRLKVQCESLSRDLKREKDETLKLRKQSRSKDSQHAHELRRIQQSGHRLREQLQKSVGTYVSKDKVLQNVQADHEKQLNMYRQTIRRLEENNGLMLREINDLREALTLHSGGIDLQVEASGIWNDIET